MTKYDKQILMNLEIIARELYILRKTIQSLTNISTADLGASDAESKDNSRQHKKPDPFFDTHRPIK